MCWQEKGRLRSSLIVIVKELRRLAGASHQTDLNRQSRQQDQDKRSDAPLGDGWDDHLVTRCSHPTGVTRAGVRSGARTVDARRATNRCITNGSRPSGVACAGVRVGAVAIHA